MARPHKNGLDYFPFDTKPDMKMNSVIMKYGATGLGCLVGLYQKIYDNGYFVKVDSDFIEDLCLELRIEDEDFLKDFIKFCIKRKLFHADFYKKHKVLTSNGIQKRFNEATKRRKCKHDVDKYFINVCNNSDNDDSNEVNDSESTQREIESKEKEKERKELIAGKGIPSFINQELWASFMEIRESNKKAQQTTNAINLLLGKLSKNPTHADKMIANSIMAGWTSVFALKGDDLAELNNNQQQTQSIADRYDFK
jgi:hypothetical protein